LLAGKRISTHFEVGEMLSGDSEDRNLVERGTAQR
jgi:hypothetical protein